MRIVAVSATMSSRGGAERIISRLTKDWADHGHEVTLLTWDAPGAAPAYPLDRRVKLRPLDLTAWSPNRMVGLLRNTRRLAVIRRACRAADPDVIVSFIDVTNIQTLTATLGLGVPVIVAERTSPAHAPIGAVWKALRRTAYRRAAKVVVQTSAAAGYFAALPSQRVVVIPNDVETPSHTADLDQRVIVAVGRLGAEKRFHLLIEAFARIAPGNPEWSLRIAGDGPLRPQLEELILRRGLQQRVELVGIQTDINAFLRRGSIFVMTSAFEGFPNALCEAMAAGLAVVSTDCPVGPREIIRHDVDGILIGVDDLEALRAALLALMASPSLRRRLATQALELPVRLDPKIILPMWRSLIEETAAGR